MGEVRNGTLAGSVFKVIILKLELYEVRLPPTYTLSV